MAALSDDGIGGGPGNAANGGSGGMDGSACGSVNGNGSGGGRGGGGVEQSHCHCGLMGGDSVLPLFEIANGDKLNLNARLSAYRGVPAPPRGGDRGPLSRGLFDDNLLGLYNNAGSFQVKDKEDEDKDEYGNGYDSNVKNSNNDGGCIVDGRLQQRGQRTAQSTTNHCTRRRRILHHVVSIF